MANKENSGNGGWESRQAEARAEARLVALRAQRDALLAESRARDQQRDEVLALRLRIFNRKLRDVRDTVEDDPAADSDPEVMQAVATSEGPRLPRADGRRASNTRRKFEWVQRQPEYQVRLAEARRKPQEYPTVQAAEMAAYQWAVKDVEARLVARNRGAQ